MCCATASAVAVKVSLLPATGSALGPSVEVDDLEGVTLLGINPSVLSRSSRIAKRCLDLVGAGLLSVLALPLLAVLAVAIKLDSRGPVFFSQERIGQGGRRFRLLKLRTMVVDAEARRDELLTGQQGSRLVAPRARSTHHAGRAPAATHEPRRAAAAVERARRAHEPGGPTAAGRRGGQYGR